MSLAFTFIAFAEVEKIIAEVIRVGRERIAAEKAGRINETTPDA